MTDSQFFWTVIGGIVVLMTGSALGVAWILGGFS